MSERSVRGANATRVRQNINSSADALQDNAIGIDLRSRASSAVRMIQLGSIAID